MDNFFIVFSSILPSKTAWIWDNMAFKINFILLSTIIIWIVFGDLYPL